MSDRQSGQTTEQIRTAPPNAVYVWVCANTHYPRKLAKTLGRTDIVFIGPVGLDRKLHANNAPVVFDHAAWEHMPYAEYEVARDYANSRALGSAAGRGS